MYRNLHRIDDEPLSKLARRTQTSNEESMLRKSLLAILSGALLATIATSVAAQPVALVLDPPCAHNARALRGAFERALSSVANIQVADVVTAEDKGELGCHVIFDMSDRTRVGGTFVTTDVTFARWRPDDDHAPRSFELAIAGQQMVLFKAELDRNYQAPPQPGPPRPNTERGAPVVMRPVKFDVKDVCGAIVRGLDSSAWFDALQVREASLNAEIGDAYRALAETDQRMGMTGLTPQQIKTNQIIRKAQDERINFDIQLDRFTLIQCPPYLQQHRFDGR